jgi:hypothetical protein
MAQNITSLTQEQIDTFPHFREKWLKIGLSTEPANFVEAKKAIIKLYKQAGLTVPKKWFSFSSPMTSNLGTYFLMNNTALKSIKAMKKKDTSQEEIIMAMQDIVNSDTDYTETMRTINSAYIWGNHEASWLAMYDFYKSIGITETEQLMPLMEIAEHCSWWAPYDDVVIMQDKPSVIHFDDENRLHAQNGPAIEYRDGFSIYCWHGVPIPEEWITKGISAANALAVTNTDQRSAACEICGWNTILRELKAKTINKDKDPMVGELVEVEIPEAGKARFLRVRCGTEREFALPVPMEMKTAREANAWTYALSAKDYAPEIRT